MLCSSQQTKPFIRSRFEGDDDEKEERRGDEGGEGRRNTDEEVKRDEKLKRDEYEDRGALAKKVEGRG